jgi:hypothetical protein
MPGGHGVRLDTHVYSGYTIPPNYDSMIAKLITTAQSREEAISKMRRALDEFVIEGIKTTIPFHRQLMDDPRGLYYCFYGYVKMIQNKKRIKNLTEKCFLYPFSYKVSFSHLKNFFAKLGHFQNPMVFFGKYKTYFYTTQLCGLKAS